MPIGYHQESSEGEGGCYLRALLVECKYIATETTLQRSIMFIFSYMPCRICGIFHKDEKNIVVKQIFALTWNQGKRQGKGEIQTEIQKQLQSVALRLKLNRPANKYKLY